MKIDYKKLHLSTIIILVFGLLVIALMTNSPMILISIFLFCLSVFITGNRVEKIKTTFIIFIPFAIITIIINSLFVQIGNNILIDFYVFRITVEAFIYGVKMAFKLLVVIYLFMLFDIMIDSDSAVSYFSAHMPKVTLVMLITMKLVPNMKKRINNIRAIYSIRGVDYEAKGVKGKVKATIPLLSILLEDSLESSFDIGEAAYVRGFLSGKRSVYDNKKLQPFDYLLIVLETIMIITYITIKSLGKDTPQIDNIFNLIIVCMIVLILILILIVAKENDYEIYRD